MGIEDTHERNLILIYLIIFQVTVSKIGFENLILRHFRTNTDIYCPKETIIYRAMKNDDEN